MDFLLDSMNLEINWWWGPIVCSTLNQFSISSSGISIKKIPLLIIDPSQLNSRMKKRMCEKSQSKKIIPNELCLPSHANLIPSNSIYPKINPINYPTNPFIISFPNKTAIDFHYPKKSPSLDLWFNFIRLCGGMMRYIAIFIPYLLRISSMRIITE
jgi:hypothetical protein